MTTARLRRPPEVPAAVVAAIRSRLAALRIAADLSPERLAAAAGLSRSAVRRIEDGHSHSSLGTLCALAAALGVEPGEFFTRKPWRRSGKKNLAKSDPG